MRKPGKNLTTPGIAVEPAESVIERLVAVLQILGAFYAIPAIIIVLVFVGENTRPYLYPIRAVFAGLCSLVIVQLLLFPRRGFWGWAQIPLAVFWGAYLLRIIFDGYIQQSDLRLRPDEYLNYAIGMCLVPMWSFFRNRSPSTLRLMFSTLFWSSTFGVALSVWVYRSLLGTSFGRLGSEEGTAVNPLTVSYMASTLVILCLYKLLYSTSVFRFKDLIYHGGIALGGVALIMGASRGPLVAVLLCGAIALYYRLKEKAFVRVILYGVGLVFLLIIGAKVAEMLGSNVAERIAYTREEAKAGSGEFGRMPVAVLAIKEFLESPLLGSGLDVKETKSYPHNLLVESLLTTGLIGGGAFIAFLLSCVLAALRLLRGPGEVAWIPMLFFAYLVESQLSGAVYMSSVFWVAAALTLTVDRQLQSGRSRHFWTKGVRPDAQPSVGRQPTANSWSRIAGGK